MKRPILLSVLLVSLLFSCASEPEEVADFETFIQQTLSEFPELPGLGIAVVHKDKPVLVKGYGMADIENDIRATKSTPFYIASTTKSFMGMLSVVLEEDGTLDLQAPLTTYKPFKDLANKEVYENITITDLLNHTSGIDNGFLTFRDAYTGDKPLDVKIMLLEEATSIKEEGKIFEYDNLGYNVLDVLLEAELGLNWRDLLDERIFTPLGMNRTSAYISEADNGNWQKAWPYLIGRTGNSSRVSLMKDDSMMQAAGGLITTAEDVVNWLLFNMNLGKLKGKQVYAADWVSRTHQRLAETNREGQIFTDTGYGLGWFTAKFKEEDIVYHFGGYPGFFSHISFMPGQEVGIAVFANEGMIGDNVSNLIATYIYDYYLGQVPGEGYAEQKENIRSVIGRLADGFQRDYDNRKDREWQLELPMDAYAGEYFNKRMGTIKVNVQNGDMHISLGRLSCIATPFVPGQMNAVRVEMTPGRGGGLGFRVEDGKAMAAIYRGQLFERVK